MVAGHFRIYQVGSVHINICLLDFSSVFSCVVYPSLTKIPKMFKFTPHFVSAALLLAGSLPTVLSQDAPTVTVLNGTYAGVHNPSYNQDYFLGIPYALPPTQGPLRFSPPASLNTSWTGQRNATAFGDICYGYGVNSHNTALHSMALLCSVPIS